MALYRNAAISRLFYRQFSQSARSLYPNKYISDSYDCKNVWKQRLQSPILSKIQLEDLFFEMDQRYIQEKAISPIDVDLFVNTASSSDYLGEVEELVHRLRKSPSSSGALPSTGHAAIRLLLEYEQVDTVLRMLSDRWNYGIFLDDYLSVMLMDKFLGEDNLKGAAKIASLHMLQEDFGSPTVQYYCLLSCLKYIDSKPEEPWEPEPEPDPREVSKEETKIKVKFLRQPGFDDHFDLTDGSHVMGKTLAWLAKNMTDIKDETLLRSLELYGYALYDKWEKVENSLARGMSRKDAYSSEVIAKVLERAEKQLKVIEESPTKSLPRPKLRRIGGMNMDADAIERLFKFMNIPDYANVIPSVIKLLKGPGLTHADLSLLPKAEELVKNAVAKNEKKLVQDQLQTYQDWENSRAEALQEQIRQYRNEQTLQEIQEKKLDLEEKEDVIFFFDNQEEWMLRQPGAVKVYRQRYKFPGRWKKQKAATSNRTTDENYVPPML